MRRVGRGEKESPADVGQVVGVRAARTGVDVLDQRGVGSRAIALPQLGSAGPVVRVEEERAVDIGQVVGDRADQTGVYVLDEGGARGRAVALPQLISADP